MLGFFLVLLFFAYSLEFLGFFPMVYMFAPYTTAELSVIILT